MCPFPRIVSLNLKVGCNILKLKSHPKNNFEVLGTKDGFAALHHLVELEVTDSVVVRKSQLIVWTVLKTLSRRRD